MNLYVDDKRFNRKSKTEILDIKINGHKKKIKQTKSKIEKILNNISFELSFIENLIMERIFDKYIYSERSNIMKLHLKKLADIGIQTENEIHLPIEHNDQFVAKRKEKLFDEELLQLSRKKTIFNLSNRNLNEIEEKALSKGLK